MRLQKSLPSNSHCFFYCVLLLSMAGFSVQAQTTSFTYQGRLSDGGQPANGPYQMQFKLFDDATVGNQTGQTLVFDGAGQNPPSVTVVNGVFTVQLDFGANPFTAGASRFLEISVKKPADATYATLLPRPQLTSSPYAIRTISAGTADALSSTCVNCVTDAQIAAVAGSKVTGTVASATNAASATSATTASDALKLGGVAANQYVQTNDSRLTDARPASSVDFGTASLSGTLLTPRGGTGLSSSGLSGNFLKSNGSIWTSAPLSSSDIPSGSGNYIRNTTSQQSADFNISGSGNLGGPFTANTVTSNSTSNLLFIGQSSNVSGSWLRLNNTSTGGHNWNIISTGSGNAEGVGKLLINDQTSGGTRMTLDSGGATFAGNGTFTGNLTVSGALNATVTTSNFATLPHCKARQTADQTIPNGTTVNVRFDDTQFCSGVTFDNANDRFLIVTPGLYQVTAEIIYLSNSSGLRYLEINSNNGGEIAAASINAVTGFSTQMNTMGLVRLNAGDAVALATAQSSGGNLNTEVFNNRAASLTINWVGP